MKKNKKFIEQMKSASVEIATDRLITLYSLYDIKGRTEFNTFEEFFKALFINMLGEEEFDRRIKFCKKNLDKGK